MATEASKITFAIDIENGGVIWFFPEGAPDLTPEEAMVINAAKLTRAVDDVSSGLANIADALNNIAEAIREKG